MINKQKIPLKIIQLPHKHCCQCQHYSNIEGHVGIEGVLVEVVGHMTNGVENDGWQKGGQNQTYQPPINCKFNLQSGIVDPRH